MRNKWDKYFRKHVKKGIFLYWGLGVIIFIITLLLLGCAPKVEYVTQYKEVKVPVKCEFQKPVRPKRTGDLILDVASNLQYIEQLEATLRKCE